MEVISMGNRAKLVIGYTDYRGEWFTQKEYLRWKDGNIEAIKPLLHKYKGKILDFNKDTDYVAWKFEELTFTGVIDAEYIYYVDNSNLLKVKCSIVAKDWDFYYKYGVDSYKVVWEGIL